MTDAMLKSNVTSQNADVRAVEGELAERGDPRPGAGGVGAPPALAQQEPSRCVRSPGSPAAACAGPLTADYLIVCFRVATACGGAPGPTQEQQDEAAASILSGEVAELSPPGAPEESIATPGFEANEAGRKAFLRKLGPRLLAKGGQPVMTDEAVAGGKFVGLYFTAHWCPPCRGFTPKLAEWYINHAVCLVPPGNPRTAT